MRPSVRYQRLAYALSPPLSFGPSQGPRPRRTPEALTAPILSGMSRPCYAALRRAPLQQAAAAGGSLKLAGVQKRVETMLTMTGAQNFLEIHPDEASAIKSFGG